MYPTNEQILSFLYLPLIPLYLIPTIIALMLKHQSTLAIGVVNVLLGWTGLGWIAALVWSLTGARR